MSFLTRLWGGSPPPPSSTTHVQFHVPTSAQFQAWQEVWQYVRALLAPRTTPENRGIAASELFGLFVKHRSTHATVIEFLLPQLCAHAHNNGDCRTLVLRLCSESSHVALLGWASVNAALPSFGESAEILLRDIEEAARSHHPPQPFHFNDNNNNDNNNLNFNLTSLDPSIMAGNQFILQRQVLLHLAKISDDLTKVDIKARKPQLEIELKRLNEILTSSSSKKQQPQQQHDHHFPQPKNNNNNNSSSAAGVFWLPLGTSREARQRVLRFVEEEAKPFSTYSRCPFFVAVEVLNAEDRESEGERNLLNSIVLNTAGGRGGGGGGVGEGVGVGGGGGVGEGAFGGFAGGVGIGGGGGGGGAGLTSNSSIFSGLGSTGGETHASLNTSNNPPASAATGGGGGGGSWGVFGMFGGNPTEKTTPPPPAPPHGKVKTTRQASIDEEDWEEGGGGGIGGDGLVSRGGSGVERHASEFVEVEEEEGFFAAASSALVERRVRNSSQWGGDRNWRLVSLIVKSGDDLRQEQFCMQLISMLQMIFANCQLPLILVPYRILPFSSTSGLMETVTDAVTLSDWKTSLQGGAQGAREISLLECFLAEYGAESSSRFRKARKNFISSMAAYSLICYLLQIKDRHNANILIHRAGYVIHIDFGFCLGTRVPVPIETAPFKLTSELVEVMGGVSSEGFCRFRELMVQGYLAIRRSADMFVEFIEHSETARLACLQTSGMFGKSPASEVKRRLHLEMDDAAAQAHVVSLISHSRDALTTVTHETFQKYFSGIKSV